MTKKIICLLAIICMLCPMAAHCETMKLESMLPYATQLKFSFVNEGKELLKDAWEYYGLFNENSYWYVFESCVGQKGVMKELYFEFTYENSFISIAAIYSETNDFPMIVILYEGEKPSTEILVNYHQHGFYAYETESNSQYKLELTNVVK